MSRERDLRGCSIILYELGRNEVGRVIVYIINMNLRS